MNILFISPSFPTRFHRIRAWQLITGLAKNNRIHLVTFAWEPVPEQELQELTNICASIRVVCVSKWVGRFRAILNMFSFNPLEVSYCNSERMRTVVQDVLTKESIDLVYVKRLRCVQLLPDTTKPVLVDSTDAMSMFYARAAARTEFLLKLFHFTEGKRYEWYEKKVSKRFKDWIVCSPRDATYLKERLPDIDVHMVPNGVDTTYFTPTSTKPKPNTLLISGLLDKFVNYEAAEYFVKQVLPILIQKNPEVTLMLVGPTGARVKQLEGKNVRVMGKVPDLRTYIADAEVVCCPVLTGAGTRNKILQAWAVGRPVVSTSIGAEGLLAKDEENILVADTPELFAEKVQDLLSDKELYRTLVQGGTEVINKCYTMSTIIEELESYLQSRIHEKLPESAHSRS